MNSQNKKSLNLDQNLWRNQEREIDREERENNQIRLIYCLKLKSNVIGRKITKKTCNVA